MTSEPASAISSSNNSANNLRKAVTALAAKIKVTIWAVTRNDFTVGVICIIKVKKLG